jgi:hypothetical protein
MNFFTENSGLDIGKLAYALFCKSSFFLDQVLENADKKLRISALSRMIKNDSFQLGYYDYLSNFPIDLLEFNNLKVINFKAPAGKWSDGIWCNNTSFIIPDDIDRLGSLEKLEIWGPLFKSLPLSAFAKMPNLKYLKLNLVKNFDLNSLSLALPNCELDVGIEN